MYESPITQILSDIQTIYEADCLKMVQKCGFDVNKTELEKALSYDRNQYQKGYKDGYADAIDEFVSRLEKHTQENWIDHQEYGITWSDIEMIAEQLKGGVE